MDRDIIGLELDLLLRRHRPNDAGVLADYIPELAKADPGWFGMSICTIDEVCHELSDRLGFHLFRNQTASLPPIRR